MVYLCIADLTLILSYYITMLIYIHNLYIHNVATVCIDYVTTYHSRISFKLTTTKGL